jgi:prepilin-type processing-associated H-X9-DG protein
VAILVACDCGQQFMTKSGNAGREAQCLECGKALTVPQPIPTAEEDDLRVHWIGTPQSGRALASLILGLFSLVFLFFVGIPAVVFGYLGLVDIRNSRGRIRGAWMAMVGIVLGVLGSTALSFLLILYVLGTIHEHARRDACQANLKRIALAMHGYHRVRNAFPASALKDKSGRPLLSWRVAILPYLGPEGQELYARFNLNEAWDGPNNHALVEMMPAVFACPGNASPTGKTPYFVVVGPRTIFTGGKRVKIAQIFDGTSNTILVGESDISVPWTAPDELTFDTTIPHSGLGSFHSDGFNVAFADGSVRTLKNTIPAAMLRALLSRDGGEVVSSSAY